MDVSTDERTEISPGPLGPLPQREEKNGQCPKMRRGLANPHWLFVIFLIIRPNGWFDMASRLVALPVRVGFLMYYWCLTRMYHVRPS